MTPDLEYMDSHQLVEFDRAIDRLYEALDGSEYSEELSEAVQLAAECLIIVRDLVR